jgi:exodeoxyribonuclease VII large subunit
VIRGGGARNELSVFDAEPIARAIAAAPVPVLTGLGHEVDRSVADEVAHTAAKTPTACAGVLIARIADSCARAEATWRLVQQRTRSVLDGDAAALGQRAHRIARRTHAALERSDERIGVRSDRLQRAAPLVLEHLRGGVDRRAERVVAVAPARLATARESLERSTRRVQETPRRHLERAQSRIDVLAARVGALDPAVQLARGWSITRDSQGAVVRSIGDVASGGEITTVTIDGSITSIVSSTTARPDPPGAEVGDGGPSGDRR